MCHSESESGTQCFDVEQNQSSGPNHGMPQVEQAHIIGGGDGKDDQAPTSALGSLSQAGQTVEPTEFIARN